MERPRGNEVVEASRRGLIKPSTQVAIEQRQALAAKSPRVRGKKEPK